MESGWSVDNYNQCKEKRTKIHPVEEPQRLRILQHLSGEKVKCEAGLRSKELGHSWLTKWLESQKPSLPEQPDEHPQPRQENGGLFFGKVEPWQLGSWQQWAWWWAEWDIGLKVGIRYISAYYVVGFWFPSPCNARTRECGDGINSYLVFGHLENNNGYLTDLRLCCKKNKQ